MKTRIITQTLLVTVMLASLASCNTTITINPSKDDGTMVGVQPPTVIPTEPLPTDEPLPTATSKPTATPQPTATPTKKPTLSPNDNFDDDKINFNLWDYHIWGDGPKVVESNKRIEINVPANSSKVKVGNEYSFGAGYASKFRIVGDFDIEIEYKIIKWSSSAGASVSLGVFPGGSMERATTGGSDPFNSYLTNYSQDAPGTIFDIAGTTYTRDLWGKLRLTRIADEMIGYFFRSGEWVAIRRGKVDPGSVKVYLLSFNHANSSNSSPINDIQVEFDNFIVNQGQVIWP